ncbi:hypothetical protein HK099_007860 [Clydaea vesicula]|uniref:DUF218 domain-containing protein n=1 Tax=Clydaea vesicula TaxID=447962 RepID=A0AAD5Y2M1_9FUNG|nr:hypothetical protein HK099_007860 [Clydaea vesicula]
MKKKTSVIWTFVILILLISLLTLFGFNFNINYDFINITDESSQDNSFKSGVSKINKFDLNENIDFDYNNFTNLIIVPGGQTRYSAGPKSEGQSYYEVAKLMDNQMFNNREFLNSVTTEEFAKDSFENLLFSICRFKEFTNFFPKTITIIGFKFKKFRFENLHLKAIKFNVKNFEYIGFDLPLQDRRTAEEGEKKFSVLPFQNDLYGCRDPLSRKKKNRNPFKRVSNPYKETCPELRTLFEYCPEGIKSNINYFIDQTVCFR